jgi:hypothetical protein
MSPLIDAGPARASAALGVLGVACTLVPNASGAATAALRPIARADALADFSRVPSGTAPAARLFAVTRRRSDNNHRSGADAVAGHLLEMTRAGNSIAKLPYIYGGGHGSFSASGYDCSGSVSYVLHAAGLVSAPEDSSGLESFGDAGPGRHVTVYANPGHAFMTIDGRRFDTNALEQTGTRWSSTTSSVAGYTARHPRGL